MIVSGCRYSTLWSVHPTHFPKSSVTSSRLMLHYNQYNDENCLEKICFLTTKQMRFMSESKRLHAQPYHILLIRFNRKYNKYHLVSQMGNKEICMAPMCLLSHDTSKNNNLTSDKLIIYNIFFDIHNLPNN